MSKLRANQIVNKASTGAPTAPNGLVVTGVSTATSFSGSGASLTNIPAGNLTGTVADARISTLTASKLTGALPAVSGANLTNLTAANLTGALPAISGANLTGISAGITMADQWRVSSNFNSNSSDYFINSNWERNDSHFAQIGTGMSYSGGTFTFPQTGIYWICFQMNCQGTNMQYMGNSIRISPDSGSSFYTRAENYDSGGQTAYFGSSNCECIVDVSNASTYRARFHMHSSGPITTEGQTNSQRTGVTFIRLGDT